MSCTMMMISSITSQTVSSFLDFTQFSYLIVFILSFLCYLLNIEQCSKPQDKCGWGLNPNRSFQV